MKCCTVLILLTVTVLTVYATYSAGIDVRGLKRMRSKRNTDDTTILNITKNATSKFENMEKTVKKAIGSIVKMGMRYAMENPDFAMINITPACQRHVFKIMMGVRKLDLWALQMLDAFGKVPSGILAGKLYSLGDYDSCLRVNVAGFFQGQYCLIGVTPSYEDILQLGTTAQKFTGALNDELLEKVLKNGLSRLSVKDLELAEEFGLTTPFKIGVCIPSTCSVHDVNTLIMKALDMADLKGWKPSISTCEVQRTAEFDSVQIAVICILGFVTSLVLTGTAIDVYMKFKNDDDLYKTDSDLRVKLLLCFSAYSNTRQLTTTSSNSLAVLHGLRAFSVAFVILTHTYGFALASRSLNSLLRARDFLKDLPYQMVLHGNLFIEIFFFMSAVFLMLATFKYPKKGIFQLLLRRLWRITPAFMFVIAFSLLIPEMGSGPIWKELIEREIGNCRNYWWRNLLFINNFIDTEHMCLRWLWYVAADMHLYIGGLLVLWAIRKFPKYTRSIFAITILSTIVILAANNVYFGIRATFIIDLVEHPTDFLNFMVAGQIGTHIHAISMNIGLVTGYLLVTKPNMKIPLKLNVFVWMVQLALACTFVLVAYEWTQGRNFPSFGVGVLYACSARVLFPLGLAWMTISLSRTTEGAFTNQISEKGSSLIGVVVVLLSKLGYMAYLLHMLTLFMYFGSAKVLIQTDHKTMIFVFLAATIVTYAAAYVFSMLFEAPFIALEKLLFPQTKDDELPANHAVLQKESNGGYANELFKYDEKDAFPNQDQKDRTEEISQTQGKENSFVMEGVKSTV